uniref:Uncharacterized protein n=1 Tax=Arundo donax TaxID=35708 RepID=A0A0A9FF65_ARUDO
MDTKSRYLTQESFESIPHHGRDVLLEGPPVLLVELLRVVVWRLLRAHIVNRRVEHHVVLRTELRLGLALEDVLELGDSLLHEVPPLLQIDRLPLVRRHRGPSRLSPSPSAAGSARRGGRVPLERAAGSAAGTRASEQAR